MKLGDNSRLALKQPLIYLASCNAIDKMHSMLASLKWGKSGQAVQNSYECLRQNHADLADQAFLVYNSNRLYQGVFKPRVNVIRLRRSNFKVVGVGSLLNSGVRV